MSPPLLDGATLRQLQRLRLRDLDAIVRGLLGDAATGAASGGRGLEFADYRPYAPGDDLRRIDWNVYARLHQPFVRTSPEERELGLSLLLDGSRSMGDAGAPARRHAERFAALLGAVALLRGGTVQLTVLADGEGMGGEPLSGEQHVPLLLRQLEHLPRGRSTELAAGIHARRPLAAGAEIAALLTDALVEEPALDAALAALHSVRAATLLHVTEPVPESPATGPVELLDRETGATLSLGLTPATLAAHAEVVESHAAMVAARCRAHGVGYVHLPADGDPFTQLAALADAQHLLARAT
ncbi:DUF58 domain-containing protein [Conexibacter stalactiti]|uniref:DUF58 domain-containing protein n=1 Tax=Conexibacter stalactiti TaxID=1940611 RepID=A0ABU4HW44_9ACTN|nr:DUF58 domain-containing protein [Conexibacter stalactiti]MDW5597450.1 DUF58 domain-containing protein [Conexibacter stalactiti]MEC5038092.1 DUF58 domain-containing protein [Conexibacter stalactiti]